MVSHPFEKCITLKEHIVRLIEDGIIILDLNDAVETSHISCETKRVSLIQFKSLEPIVLYEHGLPSPTMQEGFFPTSIFDKLAVNMTSCSEVEEEIGEEDGSQMNSLAKIDQTLAALEAINVHLHWGKSLVCLMRRISIWP